jgi:hypothetical protein
VRFCRLLSCNIAFQHLLRSLTAVLSMNSTVSGGISVAGTQFAL